MIKSNHCYFINNKKIKFVVAGTYSLIGAALIVAASGCITWNRQPEVDISHAESGQAVVGQVGSPQAVVSRKSRPYWVKMRQSKNSIVRIKGALATGEADDAVSLARAYLAQNPGDADGFSMLSSALALEGKYELSLYYAEEAYKVRPSKAKLLNIKGLAMVHGTHRSIQDYREALAIFQEAFASDDREIASGLNLGSLYLELGSPENAAEIFKQVANRCGQCFPSMIGRGTSLARARKFSEAKDVFQATLKAYPGHPTTLYNLALLEKEGFRNYPGAESYLFALLKNKDPRYASIRDRGQALLRAIKGEASSDERTMLAEDQETNKESLKSQKPGEKAQSKNGIDRLDESELLLSGAEAESP